MCGFIGSATFGGGRAPEVPNAVAVRVRWRGPDSYRHEAAADHAWGSARLAVIDLNPEADQPLVAIDGSWQLVFNGEVYNYRELAEQHALSARARRSDTWTILELVARLGVIPACRQLRGMYAFAAWEAGAKRLWLARDPFGIKPLAWSRVGATVLFGSDARSLASWRGRLGADLELDPYALTHYLMAGYVPGDATVWRSIERVEPGGVVAVDMNCTSRSEWDPLASMPTTPAATEDEVDNAFRASIARHLVADVDVGAFLSGGIDSSLAVAIARRDHDAPMRTYSVGYDSDEVHDESAGAAQMAQRLGTRHIGIRLGAGDFRNLAEAVADAFPEPSADPAAMPTMALSRRARDDVKVVLTGEGGDEVFGGYRRYWALPLARGPVGRAARLLGMVALAHAIGGRRVRQAAESVGAQPGAAYLRYLTQLHWDAVTPVSGLCTPETVSRVVGRYQPDPEGGSSVSSLRHMEMRQHLPETYLEKSDRATMRHGLEARVPFLDLDLAAVAMRLSGPRLARPGRTKLTLRRVAARHLPTGVTGAPKRGFSVPLRAWMATPESRDWITRSLVDGAAVGRGILDPATLPRALAAMDGAPDSGGPEARYRLLSLELWCRSAGKDGAL